MQAHTVAVPQVDGVASGRLGDWLFKHWLIACLLFTWDILVWSVVFAALVSLRGTENTSLLVWLTSGAIGLACIIGAMYVIRAYNARTDMMTLIFAAEYMMAIAVAAGCAFVLIYAAASYSQNIKPSRAVLLVTFAVAPTLGLLMRRFIASLTQAQNSTREFLVLGGGDLARRFYRSYQQSKLTQKLRFVSSSSSGLLAGADSPPVGSDPLRAVQNLSSRVAGVIIAEEAEKVGAELTTLLIRTHFELVPVYTLESFYDTFWQKVPVMALGAAWPLQKGFPLSADTPYGTIKRVFDVLAALMGLLVFSPLMALIALVVRWESKGPIIFSQERLGWHQHPFYVFKFRTMFERAEEGSIYTETNDRRITKVGKWLRKLRLDELPQLWNVLRGDMSLIGPRAEWVKCVALYQDQIPSYHFRHLVRPGITGWAQVNYPYGASLEDAVQKLKYDLYYVRHYSLKLDAMIVLKTIHVVFLGKGT